MIPGILLYPGNLIVILQMYLLGKLVMTHQIHLLLGGPVTIPQIYLLPEGLVMIPPIYLAVPLIHCPEPKAVKPQKEPLASLLHTGRGQDPLVRHSQRTANMSMPRTSLRHEKSKQNPTLGISSMILKALLPAIGNFI